MSKIDVNRQNLLCVKLLELRRHLNICRECRAAMKSKDPAGLCKWSLGAIVEVAIKWDRNIPGRLAKSRNGDTHIFPCPDPNAHGSAYALSAEAVTITSTQDGLF